MSSPSFEMHNKQSEQFTTTPQNTDPIFFKKEQPLKPSQATKKLPKYSDASKEQKRSRYVPKSYANISNERDATQQLECLLIHAYRLGPASKPTRKIRCHCQASRCTTNNPNNSQRRHGTPIPLPLRMSSSEALTGNSDALKKQKRPRYDVPKSEANISNY